MRSRDARHGGSMNIVLPQASPSVTPLTPARPGMSPSVDDDAPDRLALMHQIESIVDLLERHGVGDHRIDIDLPIHIPVDDLRHIRATPRAAKGGAAPHAAGDELERPGRNF